jgi:hypothetical protein
MADRDKGDKYVRLTRAYLVRDRGAQEVRDLVGELSRGLFRLFALCALCLADDPTDIQKRAARETVPKEMKPADDWFVNGLCIDFLANPSTAMKQRLLEATADSGYSKINAHFTIAMSRLAAKDRNGAYEHFNECTATKAVGNISYEMARAYVKRMEDPNWPSWLCEKAEE